MGGVDVTSPDPVLTLPSSMVVEKTSRLRIVDDDELIVARKLVGVHLVVPLPDRLHLVRKLDVHSLQPVVRRLGDVEELIGALNDPPLGIKSHVDHQRHQRLQHLGHAAAVGRGVDVHDAGAPKRLGHLHDLGNSLIAHNTSIVG